MSQKSFLFLLQDFVECFLNLPEWLKWTMLCAVIATAYLTSSFPLTVCLWKDFLSDEVYVPPHFFQIVLCGVRILQWIYNLCMSYQGHSMSWSSHCFRESESFKGMMEASGMVITKCLWNLDLLTILKMCKWIRNI